MVIVLCGYVAKVLLCWKEIAGKHVHFLSALHSAPLFTVLNYSFHFLSSASCHLTSLFWTQIMETDLSHLVFIWPFLEVHISSFIFKSALRTLLLSLCWRCGIKAGKSGWIKLSNLSLVGQELVQGLYWSSGKFLLFVNLYLWESQVKNYSVSREWMSSS